MAALKYLKCLLLVLLASTAVKAQQDSVQIIPDTLLFRIQKAQSVVTEVNASNKKGFNLPSLSVSLTDIRNSIAPLQQDFKNAGNKIDTKNLLNYELILKDAGENLAKLRNALVKHNNELQQMSQQVVALSNDSILTESNDNIKKLYRAQLRDIKNRLQLCGKLTGSNLEKVGSLLADVSELDIVVNDLRAQLTDRLQQSGKMAMGREAPFLWDATRTIMNDRDFFQQLNSSYQGQWQILSYFLESTWDKRFLSFLLAAAFFIWVHRNFRLAKRPAVKRKIGDLHFSYLKPFPVLAAVIIYLNIAPLFESGAPSFYIELLLLLQLLAISIHLRKTLQAPELRKWWLLVITFAALILSSNINSDGLLLRLVQLGLNLFFIYMGANMFRKFRLPQFSRKYTKAVVLLFITFNVLAILLNIFGRVSLGKSVALAGVAGLVQLIGLAVFIQLITDALELQLRISACSKGIFSRVDHGRTRASTKKALRRVAAVLWIIVFLINLNLTSGTLAFFEAVLSKERSFGSVHFTLGNILFFLLIVYIANKIQKNIPVFFGEGNLSYEGEVEQKSSKVALIRLVIIVLGLLLALTASGLPMDRVTVVLGALGVGIGLGMQNIVNNFVSGIILIFERPFRIGDFVELADKKGRVKDIGIRSSKLLTQQGSEVIIPNGDLLSGRLVNWTLSHDYAKTELLFKVGAETNLDELKNMVAEEAAKTSHSMDNLETEVLVNAILAGAIEIKVMAWIENIYVEPMFRSELMSRLLQRFTEAGIKIM